MTQRLIYLFLVITATAIATAGCSRSDAGVANAASEPPAAETRQDDVRLKLSEAERRSAGIVVQTMRDDAIAEQIMVTATIEANQDRLARVAPRIAARVASVKANLGETVSAGQTLAVLDSVELGKAWSGFVKARVEARLATANFRRLKGLYEQQIVAQKDFLRAQAENEIARTTLKTAEDQLHLLGVTPRPDQSGVVSTFPVLSPFSGTVIEKDAVIGELKHLDKPMFTIADLSTLWIEANVPEKDLGKLQVGAQAAVKVAAYPDQTFDGRLTYIGAALDRKTRTVRARIEVPNPDDRLKLQMFATAAINTSARRNALLLPQDAVVLLQGQSTAFVVHGNGFEPRAIEVGERISNRVIVRAGLKPGEQVVTVGAYALKARLLKSQIGDSH